MLVVLVVAVAILGTVAVELVAVELVADMFTEQRISCRLDCL